MGDQELLDPAALARRNRWGRNRRKQRFGPAHLHISVHGGHSRGCRDRGMLFARLIGLILCIRGGPLGQGFGGAARLGRRALACGTASTGGVLGLQMLFQPFDVPLPLLSAKASILVVGDGFGKTFWFRLPGARFFLRFGWQSQLRSIPTWLIQLPGDWSKLRRDQARFEFSSFIGPLLILVSVPMSFQFFRIRAGRNRSFLGLLNPQAKTRPKPVPLIVLRPRPDVGVKSWKAEK